MSAVMELESPPVAVPPHDRSGEEPLYEVVNGERVDLPDMSVYANLVAKRVLLCLEAWCLENPVGVPVIETLLILDREADLRRRPDVAWISFQRWPADKEIPETGDWEVVPDLAVEVVSPSDIMKEVLHKVHEYLDYGVTEVWLIVPEEEVLYRYRSATDIQVVAREGVLTGDPLLPGFRLSMTDLLQRKLAVAPSAIQPA